MKYLQILILLLAGALAGLVIMKVWLGPPVPGKHMASARKVTSPAEPARPPVLAAAPSKVPEEVTPVPRPDPPTSAAASAPSSEPARATAPAHRTARPAKRVAWRRPSVEKTKAVRKSLPASASYKPAPASAMTSTAPPKPSPPAVRGAEAAKVNTVEVPRQSPEPAKAPEAQTASRTAEAPHTVVLNPGLVIPVRLVESVSSEWNRPGDTFIATVDQEIVVDGFVIVERGAPVEGRVIAAERGSPARLVLELTKLYTADRQRVTIQSEWFERGPDASAEVEAYGVARGRGAPARVTTDIRIPFRLRTSITLTERRG